MQVCMTRFKLLGVSTITLFIWMTFGRDTDEVNGFEPYHSDASADTCVPYGRQVHRWIPDLHSDDHGSFDGDFRDFRSLHLPRRPHSLRSSETTDEDSEHPRYNPGATRCDFCKHYGHSLMNCEKRFRLHQRKMKECCEHGYHKPHLHDCEDLWRCEWCLMHLHAKYVRKWYPDEYVKELEKVRALRTRLLAKYADRRCNFPESTAQTWE